METASGAEPGGLFLEAELFFHPPPSIFEENGSSFWVGKPCQGAVQTGLEGAGGEMVGTWGSGAPGAALICTCSLVSLGNLALPSPATTSSKSSTR